MKQLKYVILTSFLYLNAQSTVSISGFIRNDANGEPLAYTNVFIKEIKQRQNNKYLKCFSLF